MSRAHKFTSRTKARKRAVDVVFEADQRGMGRNSEVLRDLLRERKVITAALTPLPEYSIEIIQGVADNLSRIDKLIEKHAKTPGLYRLAAVDLATMRVATWEMLAQAQDVSPIIAIDEALSIVTSISTDSSPAFVNAVLDAIRKDLESPAWQRNSVTSSADSLSSYAEQESNDSERVDELHASETQKRESQEHSAENEQRYLTMADITAADLAQLDELLDEY
ncbi:MULTISPECIES: transcription antitermination factor NusB [unclassified Schaalia]|uniref:transcription antitermination factor NusB n=1 Tax=unclassified Schaalia TaxID=2691889 RepID=UPI001E492FFF|nr:MULTISPECIES: transcription antitermination factor NusB [unclassified Schaalia]MCD4549557.1 transcription antitermination factor NusB [Schaalia sp. lx-260]MCD4558172.1 transcription antitermination factor NusB [Schaalia sp. lx-100]